MAFQSYRGGIISGAAAQSGQMIVDAALSAGQAVSSGIRTAGENYRNRYKQAAEDEQAKTDKKRAEIESNLLDYGAAGLEKSGADRTLKDEMGIMYIMRNSAAVAHMLRSQKGAVSVDTLAQYDKSGKGMPHEEVLRLSIDEAADQAAAKIEQNRKKKQKARASLDKINRVTGSTGGTNYSGLSPMEEEEGYETPPLQKTYRGGRAS